MFLKNPVGLNVLKKGPPKKPSTKIFAFYNFVNVVETLGTVCKLVLSQFPFPDARLLWLIDPTTYGLYINKDTFLNVLLQQRYNIIKHCFFFYTQCIAR